MEYFGKNKIIEKLKELKELAESKKELIKIVAIPVMVIVAVLFFWINAGQNEIKIDEAGSQTAETDLGAQSGVGQSQVGEGLIYVDIGGEVEMPGVYEVSQGTRLFQVIERAGGLTEDADIDGINRAEAVFDGQKIIIGTKGESGDSGESRESGKTTHSNYEDEGKVNINTANSAELQSIPGIGPSKAERIIEYRESEGRFNTIDDIKNISGIGNKTFENIKEYITV